MLRIRTKIGKGRVFTLFFEGRWVTLFNDGNKPSSTDADNLADAGYNHMVACKRLKEITDERARCATKLLHGERCQGDDSRGVAGSNGESNRRGTDGDGRDERDQNLPSNPSVEEDQDALQIGSQDAELGHG